jgi:hypothetical protein
MVEEIIASDSALSLSASRAILSRILSERERERERMRERGGERR